MTGKSVKMPIATGRVGSFAATFTGMAIAGTSNQHGGRTPTFMCPIAGR
ncbi:MAG: hypothetical protein ACXABL_15400 [Candidatus Thorarchaeota archaeon]